MTSHDHPLKEFQPIAVALLCVSDTRTLETDTSGQYLAREVQEAGHTLVARALTSDDRYQIRAVVSQWIASPEVQAVIITGGTGLTGRDGTPEAVAPLLDKILEGFGELFRHLSYAEIGVAAMLSRGLAGIANGTMIFCLPGSTAACRTAWAGILRAQLDCRTQPCNLVALWPRFTEG